MNLQSRIPLARILCESRHPNGPTRHFVRLFSSTSTTSAADPRSQIATELESLPTVAECPNPTCPCAEMPTGLDIDYKKTLRGTMPRYSRHIVIHTGQDDWESRIEDGPTGIENGKSLNLARELKVLMGPKGKYHKVCKFRWICGPRCLLRGKLIGPRIIHSRTSTTSSQTAHFWLLPNRETIVFRFTPKAIQSPT